MLDSSVSSGHPCEGLCEHSGGQLFLVEVNDVHLGLLPNELAGVHKGNVPPKSQAISLLKPFHRTFCGE